MSRATTFARERPMLEKARAEPAMHIANGEMTVATEPDRGVKAQTGNSTSHGPAFVWAIVRSAAFGVPKELENMGKFPS